MDALFSSFIYFLLKQLWLVTLGVRYLWNDMDSEGKEYRLFTLDIRYRLKDMDSEGVYAF